MLGANPVFSQEMTWSPTATRFTLWTPVADSVRVNIYTAGLGGAPVQTLWLTREHVGDKWSCVLPGDHKGKFYTFQVKHAGQWLAENPGIAACAVGVNGQRGAIIDLRDTNPEGWQDDRSPAFTGQKDAIIYELHHRDFSVDPSSGIKNKGKFLALTERGTHNADGLATGLDHLVELGVTHVHILPSYDYGSIDETTGLAVGGGGREAVCRYNWGYDPVNYNAPEGSYSTDAFNPLTRIREFKLMVQAMHRAGLRVIMDVVYNHVFDLARSPFERTVPGYFFRHNADGTPANGSGCGNETASEKAAFRNFMIESVAYWMTEYHVDGFRFDLMGIHDIETMNLIRQRAQEIDPNVVIYGEGWAASTPQLPTDELAMKANTSRLGGIAAFCDEMRDGLRGGWQDDKEGAFLIANAGNEESVKFGIAGAIDHPGVNRSRVNYSHVGWASEPSQMISYVSCHDDMCLADRLKCSLSHKAETSRGKIKADLATRVRLQKLAETAVLTSQGVPFIWCGDEIMRSKKMVHNSFASPDSINQIPWSQKTEYREVFDYVRQLIALRKAHPAFRMGRADLVRDKLTFLPVKNTNVVAWTLDGRATGDTWDDIVVILNSNPTPITQAVPKGRYTVVCTGGRIDLGGLAGFNGARAVVPAQSALIMYKN